MISSTADSFELMRASTSLSTNRSRSSASIAHHCSHQFSCTLWHRITLHRSSTTRDRSIADESVQTVDVHQYGSIYCGICRRGEARLSTEARHACRRVPERHQHEDRVRRWQFSRFEQPASHLRAAIRCDALRCKPTAQDSLQHQRACIATTRLNRRKSRMLQSGAVSVQCDRAAANLVRTAASASSSAILNDRTSRLHAS